MSAPSHGRDADVIVIGGGIVGVSAAWNLLRARPGQSILLIEKEDQLAAHQTGRNSGVIHAGVYYAPGSLKARFCREGSEATYAFAREHGIPTEQCGKLIVATERAELGRLDNLFERAVLNGLEPERITREQLAEIEPNVTGEQAILVRSSGITDYGAITRKLAELVAGAGATIRHGVEVEAIEEGPGGVTVSTTAGPFHAGHAVVCGGLMADRLARMCKLDLDFRIIPFRGEYFRLPERHNRIVNHLIYPVPDPDLPFLGVHLTRMIDGSVTVGPNAVLALAREGYRWRDVNLADLAGTLTYPGFWKMIAANLGPTCHELVGSASRSAYLALCRRYCPSLTLDDLEPYPAGVRAQAVTRSGELVHDFVIRQSARCLHVCNAPSPAATSAIPIGRHIATAFADMLDQA